MNNEKLSLPVIFISRLVIKLFFLWINKSSQYNGQHKRESHILIIFDAILKEDLKSSTWLYILSFYDQCLLKEIILSFQVAVVDLSSLITTVDLCTPILKEEENDEFLEDMVPYFSSYSLQFCLQRRYLFSSKNLIWTTNFGWA